MSYHYTEAGLDNIWLENGYTIEKHPNYGELLTIANARGLHEAIGRWLVAQPRRLTGAEFRFLRNELDMSQRVTGDLLGVTEQSVAKWERARSKAIANQAAERLLRGVYLAYLDKASEFSAMLDRLTKLDAEIAECELHLTNANHAWAKAA